MDIPRKVDANLFGALRFEEEEEPGYDNPLDNAEIEDMMIRHMVRLMQENDSPPEQYQRLGLEAYC